MAFDISQLEQNGGMWDWLTKLVNSMSSNQTEGLNPQITSGKGSVDWLKYFAGLKQGNWQTMLNWLGQYLVGQKKSTQDGQPGTNFLNLNSLNTPVMGGLQPSAWNKQQADWEQSKREDYFRQDQKSNPYNQFNPSTQAEQTQNFNWSDPNYASQVNDYANRLTQSPEEYQNNNYTGGTGWW